MKRLLALLFCLLFVVTEGGYAKDYVARKKTGNYEVEITIDRNPLILGDNRIGIEIRDRDNNYVTDTKVLVNYYMPPMLRMPPMNYRIDAKLKGEKYKATMNFIMTGPWYIVIIFHRGGKVFTAKFNVDVP